MSKKLTTEEFIREAKVVHGNKYDYSLVEYKGNSIPVKIICPKHGIFEQTKKSHIDKKGMCLKCARKSLTEQEFLEKANKIHKNKFDYSKVIYKGVLTPIIIGCPIHGEIKQIPFEHLRSKFGCGLCAKMNLIPLKDLIEQSKKIHNNKYDYSKVKLISKGRKVEIICSVHGVFEQSFEKHIDRKQGCPICSGNVKMTTEQFIKKARQIHGDKYDYSKVYYVDNHTKVKIVCATHGEFLQIPANHTNINNGCPKCIGRNKTTEEFIKESIKIHGDKYDYSKTIYKSIKAKIGIICLKHGEFLQNPSDHLCGHGCPHCQNSKGENKVRNFLLTNYIVFKPQYKFKDCKHKLPLPFDFYLSDLNACIEYDGKQHSAPVKTFGGEAAHQLQVIKDQIKTDYCLKNNIPLIRIRYDENIEEVLMQKLILK